MQLQILKNGLGCYMTQFFVHFPYRQLYSAARQMQNLTTLINNKIYYDKWTEQKRSKMIARLGANSTYLQ